MKTPYTPLFYCRRSIVCLLLFGFFIVSANTYAQNETILPASALKLRPSYSGNLQTLTGGDPRAYYSNITNDLNATYANGGAAVENPSSPKINTITALVADNLTFAGSPPYTIGTITFTITNGSPVPVTVRPRVRIYNADGPGGLPGTIITGFTISSFTFPANSSQTYQPTINSFQITNQTIWAGLTFDNDSGRSGATVAQLNLMGQKLFNPPDKGSSSDLYFKTSSNGSFFTNNPPGATANFNGNPVANFGWEFVPPSFPLPITIEYLRGRNDGNSNLLEWKVDCINSAHANLVLQRKSGTEGFKDIYTLNADANECLHPFAYNDNNASASVNYYRLKMKDDKGVEKLSDIIAILNKSLSFELNSIYPNPVVSNTASILKVISSRKGKISLQVYDIIGKQLINESRDLSTGENKYNLNFTNLNPGSYKLKITDTEGTTKTLSFIKQ